MLISIIITIKNESDTIKKLLDSIIVQEKPFEIIIVDANSDDCTREIIEDYQKKYSEIKLYIKAGSRGTGRNYGVSKAQGEIIAFTDGGCNVDNNWLKSIRQKIVEGYDIVAGRTIDVGSFREIKRVEIEINNTDITWPSCNLAYQKSLFEKISGYDERFITAEDIDLNFRAIEAGGTLAYEEKAIIYRQSAQNLRGLMKQSFWYGYGRKQLTLKHGKLWKNYSAQQMLQTQFNFQGLIRNLFGLLGYLICKINSNQ